MKYGISKIIIAVLGVIAISGCQSQQAQKETGMENSLEGLELEMCIDPRPEICTMEYLPVCGYRDNGKKEPYPSGCGACSNPEVIGFLAGECPE